MAILSVGVTIIHKNPIVHNATDKNTELVERYRVEYSSFDKMEDLLKYQIDIIAEKYKFENIISVKFTG